MRAILLLLCMVVLNHAYPFYGVSHVEQEITEQRVSQIDAHIEQLEDLERHLLDSLDAAYEDIFNAGCSKAKKQLQKVIKQLRTRIIEVRKQKTKAVELMKKTLWKVNPRARNSIIRHLKIEKRLTNPLF